MFRNEGDTIAGFDLLGRVFAGCGVFIGQRVVGRIGDERVAKLGVEIGVVRRQSPASGEGPVQTQFHALTPGFANVVEIAFETRFGGDEEDVVLVVRAEHGRVPAQVVVAAAQAQFVGGGDHLFQRRIVDEAVGQPTRRIRVGTGQLDRRGRARRLRQAGEAGQVVVDLPGQPAGQVQALELVIAGQAGVVVIVAAGEFHLRRGVVQRDRCTVVAPGQRPFERLGDRHTLQKEQAGGAVVGRHAGQRFTGDDAAAHGAALVGEAGQFGLLREIAAGVVEAGADDQLAAEHAVLPALQVQTEAVFLGLRGVFGAADHAVAGHHRIAIGIEDDFLVAAVFGFFAEQARIGGVFAVLELGAVAVEGVDFGTSIVGAPGQGKVVAVVAGAAQVEHHHVRVGFVRVGEHRIATFGVGKLRRNRAIAAQAVVGGGDRKIQGAVVGERGKLGEQLGHVGIGEIAPAVFGHALGREVPCVGAVVAASLHMAAETAEVATEQLGLGAFISEAGPGLDRYRTAERVLAEQRVGPRDQIDRIDRDLRYQVPVDGVAKGLVDTHAILVDRQPLRQSEQGRGGITAVIEVRLERVVGGVVDVDAAQLLLHELVQVERFAAFDALAFGVLHVGRVAVGVHLTAGKRRGADDIDAAQFEWLGGGAMSTHDAYRAHRKAESPAIIHFSPALFLLFSAIESRPGQLLRSMGILPGIEGIRPFADTAHASGISA